MTKPTTNEVIQNHIANFPENKVNIVDDDDNILQGPMTLNEAELLLPRFLNDDVDAYIQKCEFIKNELQPVSEVANIETIVALEILENYLETPEEFPALDEFQECHGINETRHIIARDAVLAWQAFEPLAEMNGHCFDYEILPMAMAHVYADSNAIEWPQAMKETIETLDKTGGLRNNKKIPTLTNEK